ncbi:MULTISPECIES: oxygen-independent coproporphyrinogen III oxidase [unclassified Vibrio]|uniref:Coproporphyrinogen-III oxidase n=1 Tax=Vibrio sp. HB236076 TaxID=3232307 RepID=A0AB39HG87_9VIBR|nr:oxygen-independent coproporphyrinogen III oxidase [Vibrio sp. HB161653]MDP5255200.1 oxygen-independent coproporphyrinogen III oxidase [Vibrio sp. HB161653]
MPPDCADFNPILWDQATLDKYDLSGPRYTSYPTALEFHEAFTISDFDMACTQYPERPLSLYIHIPFCHTLCYYCGCNKVITRHQFKADEYLDVLEHEIRQRAPLLDDRKVTQLHFGGGTPTFLTHEQMTRLMNLLRQEFFLADSAEVSIEIDPRECEVSLLDDLAALGFNRISIGVQDFDPEVQAKVNRQQSEALINGLVDRAQALGFSSTNLDLIYGLPTQTLDSFSHTIDKVIALRPERLSVFNYAHMPERFAAQRKIHSEDLPSREQKMAILQMTIQRLTQAGYQYIGMDHFALPDDELAVAQRQGQLHRNFQGYTTQANNDLMGFGVSAISMMGDSYAQNHKTLRDYYQQVNDQRHALAAGLQLERDDLIRRDVIQSLMCHFQLDTQAIEQRFSLHFTRYFAKDIRLLQPLLDDGLVVWQGKILKVSDKGRLLIRTVCMCFDRYLGEHTQSQSFSRVI